MESLWSKKNGLRKRGALEGNIRTDAAVIGAGMAGILTAYFLSKKGIRCVVLEARSVGSGQTKNTTAKITSQHGMHYGKMISHFGKEKTRQYAGANEKAISEYFRIAKEENIACMLEEMPAYLYTKTNGKALEEELAAARTAGIAADITEVTALPYGAVQALRFSGQAQFEPMQFLGAMAEKVTVYENTMATSVEEQEIRTENGIVTADNIVVATHFPFINAPGYFFARMHQERSYVLALENAPHLGGLYYGIDEDGLSFRNSGPYLLVGGGGHRTGENPEGGKYEMLRRFARQHYPEAREAAHWSAQDCMPLDGVPYIGQYAASTPHLFVATGFQKWGMTSSMVSAMILSELIAGNDHPYPVFAPQRFNLPASAKTLAEDGIQSVKGLAAGFFAVPEETAAQLPKGHGGIVEVGEHKMGVYKDEDGVIFSVSARCSHLGCQLAWNPDERSWDCPCHGSRFDYRGNLIDNPAMKGIGDSGGA